MSTYDTRGYIYYLMGSYDQAVEDLNQAIAQFNRDTVYYYNAEASIYYHRALALNGQGDTAAALADCEKALELEPDNAEAAALLAELNA
jgi:tetratricopeptide (TPR) repeat protein